MLRNALQAGLSPILSILTFKNQLFVDKCLTKLYSNSMDQSISQQVGSPIQPATKGAKHFSKKLLIFGIGIIALLAAIILSIRALQSGSAKDPLAPIAKVGNEILYRKDLDTELQNYPPEIKNRETLLRDKLVEDSITLQAGAQEGLTQLNTTVFNSPNKDYAKRIQAVEEVKEKLANQNASIKGAIVSIWFNNIVPGPIGYEKGKQLAFATISKLYNQVRTNQITIQEAGKAIKNDPSLAQVDPVYKDNAITTFTASAGKSITFDKTFDDTLRNTKPGDITPLYLAKDKNYKGQIVDAVYMFGQVTEKKADGKDMTFGQWYDQNKNKYPMIRYK